VDRRRLSVGLMLNVSVIAFEALSVATIAPRVARDLGGLELYGWTFAAFMLANLVSVVLAGHASDRHGPAAPFAIGLVVFIAGLLLCGLAPTMPVLVAGRAVQGLGAGAMVSTAYVAIGRAYDEHERARQFALLSTAWVIPGLAAPALAGVIAEELGWRFVFLGLAVLPVIAAWLSLPVMRTLGVGVRLTEGVLPVGAAVRLAAGAGLLVAGLGADELFVVVPLVLLGVGLGVPAFRHLTPTGTLRGQRGMPAAIATRGLETFAFFGTDAFLALTLASVRDLSAVGVGLVLTPATLTWTAGSWLQAHRSGRWTRRAMATAGMSFVAAGIVLAASALFRDVPVWVAGVAWGVGGFGMGLSYSTASTTVLSEAGEDSQGAAASALQLSDGLGQALGTGLGGAIVAVAAAGAGGRRDALATVFALMFVIALVGIVTSRRFPQDPAGLRATTVRSAP
jgi:MFS family permease